MDNVSYRAVMQYWEKVAGDLIRWKTRPGDPLAQFYKVLGVSRPSHLGYLTDNPVPDYIARLVELISAQPEWELRETIRSALGEQAVQRDVDQLAKEAIVLWEQLTGQAVDSTSYLFNMGGGFNLSDANKEIQKALAMENASLTVTLILQTLLRAYGDQTSFTVNQLMACDGKLADQLEQMRALDRVLTHPTLKQTHDAFLQYCVDAVCFYRGTNYPYESGEQAKTESYLRANAGRIGMAAYYSMDHLTKLMVTDGPTGDVTDAKLSQFVFSFRNIEDLLSHSKQIPTGFSLCTILCESISDSYFALIVRNGQRITLLTDKGNYSHPLQESMMRARNSRYNAQRIDNSYFPYELLDIVWGDNERSAVQSSDRTDLVIGEEGLPVIGSLSDISARNLLWLQLFIDQCKQRYFTDAVKEPQLAIGSMYVLEHPWLLENHDKHLPAVPAEFQLTLDIKTSTELTTEFMHDNEPTWRGTVNKNEWMLDRFASQVPDEALYIPAPAMDARTPQLEFTGTDVKLIRNDLSHIPSYRHDTVAKLQLAALDVTALSTPERVRRDAHYLARHNQSEVLYRLALADFKARREEMDKWFGKAVKKNLPQLLNDLMGLNHIAFFADTPYLRKVLDITGESKGPDNMRGIRLSDSMAYARCIKVIHEPANKQLYSEASGISKHLKLFNKTYMEHICAVIGNYEPAQLFFELEVSNVLDLLNITGLRREQLPPELQYYGLSDGLGNSNLERLDPLACMRNPWDSHQFRFRLPISLKAFKAYRKRVGLPEVTLTHLEDGVQSTLDRYRCAFTDYTDELNGCDEKGRRFNYRDNWKRSEESQQKNRAARESLNAAEREQLEATLNREPPPPKRVRRKRMV